MTSARSLRPGPLKMRLMIAPLLLLTGALALPAATPAAAKPVATNDTEYAVLGRVFPEMNRTVGYMTYPEFAAGIRYLEQRYPGRLAVGAYGKSMQDRELIAVELTDEASPIPYAERRKILVDASIHGNERPGVEGSTRFLEDMAMTTDPHRLAMLRQTVLVVTYPNPDGWAKGDPTALYGHTRETAAGVDPNRDFPSIGYVRDVWTPLSEPESKATVALYEQDRLADAVWGASLHCFTSSPRSLVQILVMAGEFDLAENLANQRFSQQAAERIAAATASSQMTATIGRAESLKPAMYGTLWETRRKLNTGVLGNCLAMDEPGRGVQGLGFEHYKCESEYFNPIVQAHHVEAVRTELLMTMEAAVEGVPNVRLQLPGRVGYLYDDAVVTDADGAGYVPKNASEQSYGQRPYAATRMRFFADLARYAAGDVVAVQAGAPQLDGLRALVVTEDLGGTEPAALADWVRAGGTLVLTDGAVASLPQIAGVAAGSVTRRTDLLVRMTETSRDFTHPLLAGLNRADHYAEQLYEPVPLGFSLDENASPWWSVDAAAYTAAGGRVAALDPQGGVVVGDLPLGAGRVVTVGGLLPQPTEAYLHPYGLADYAVTYTGYQILLNALGATIADAAGG